MSAHQVQQRMELVKSALGKDTFDLIIKNVRVLNVYSEEIIPGSIGIKNGRVVTLQADSNA